MKKMTQNDGTIKQTIYFDILEIWSILLIGDDVDIEALVGMTFGSGKDAPHQSGIFS